MQHTVFPTSTRISPPARPGRAVRCKALAGAALLLVAVGGSGALCPMAVRAGVGIHLAQVASGAVDDPLVGGVNQPVRVPSADLQPAGEDGTCGAAAGCPADPCIAQLASGAQQVLGGQLPSGAIQTALILGVLSLAPAILLMTTSYVRIAVVLGLLRQALGAQQLPSNQVLAALSIFVTILVMAPVWQEIRREAVDPCLQSAETPDWEQVCQRGAAPLKRFMLAQIIASGNVDALNVFLRYGTAPEQPLPSTVTAESASALPMQVVMPAFLVSELKVAFLIGFQIFLPFLVLDLIVSTLGVSMGMVMLPPTMVSLPLKLILFVLADGWNLVMGMLLQGFVPWTQG